MFRLKPTQRRWIELLLVMTAKEISSKYRMAAFGFLWMLINPLLQMLVTGFVLQFFVQVKGVSYFEYLFPGFLVWNFFSLTLTKCTVVFVNERQLMQKTKFPREILVVAVVLSNLIHFFIALVLFVLWEALVVLEWHWYRWWLLPEIILWLTFLTTGLSLLTSSLNVKWRDANFVVQGTLPLLFYSIPIVYTLELLPSWLVTVLYLNPLTSVVELMRWVTLGTPIHWGFVVLGLVETLIIFVVGWVTFKKQSVNFDDWL